jgi:hypothetical protein
VSTPDINGNGSPELAVARVIGEKPPEAVIRDSVTKAAIGKVVFADAGVDLVDLSTLSDVSGEGISELVALFRQPDGPAVVQLRDAQSGALIERLRYFGVGWNTTAITGIDTGMDGPDIAVLGNREADSRTAIQFRGAVDATSVSRMHFPTDPAREYRDVSAVPDVNGDGQPDIATLFTRENRKAKVVIKDGKTGAWINAVGFPGTQFETVGADAVGLSGMADLSDDGAPDIAVLWRKDNGQGVVQIRDAATGKWIRQMAFFGNEWNVLGLTSLDSNRDGISEIAVLAVRKDGTNAAVQIRDASSREALNWIGFSTGTAN